MAAKKSTEAAASWRVGKRTGNVKVTVAVSAEQFDWLHKEASKRAQVARMLRPDTGAIVREALAAYMKRR